MIDDKFLPIGTICKVNKSNHLVMIDGYLPVDYNDKIIIYDYSGCIYPEGLLKRNLNISFNHSDIIEIVYIGYKNNDFDTLNSILKGQSTDKINNENNTLFKNIEFDENGVVIFATKNSEPELTKTEVINENNLSEVKNPFLNNYSNNIIVENKAEQDSSQWPIFTNIKFDENGIVVSSDVEYKKVDE